MNYTIINNKEAGQFEIELNGKTAHEQYSISGSVITFIGNYVPPEFRGKGIAAEMAKYGFEYARANNLKVVILCPYIKDYARKHIEYKDLLV
jgi:predicted GNAT family acetyltransferase